MKRDFTTEEFEKFLKESADSLRMKAPERVWQSLSKELHKRRRRFIAGLGAFFLISATVGYFTINGVSQQAVTPSKPPVTQQKAVATIQSGNQNPASVTQSSVVNSNTTIQQQANKTAITPGGEEITAITAFTTSAGVDPTTNFVNSNESTDDKNDFTATIVDSYTEFDVPEASKQTEASNRPASLETLPLTIESVINSYRQKRKNKLETQFYFTPTISYRKLTENKSYLRTATNAPANYPALYSSVNSNVTHKPDIGFELGFATKYPLSQKIKLRTGLQFNVNRYDVKAFNSPLSIATIALNNGSQVNTVNTISGYSTKGYQASWLQNLSFQASAPIGAELLLKSTDKVQFGIAATVQPTYVLGDRAYLITTDYKNYTQVPWLIRRWNVNTALETFVTYKAAKKTWQFGPQVRYQLLSSFDSQYPVKENLFDFGLKVGITSNKK